MSVPDPRPALDAYGIRWVQDTDPGYGYDGTFQPECVFLHWTASAAGSNVAQSVLVSRCYHACVDRHGLVHLGGWAVRQGHGGNGRTEPINEARGGVMDADRLARWQSSSQADDTSSMANQYGWSLCLDVNGVDEAPSPAQYEAFICCAAAMLRTLGLGAGHVIDHASSTNRKIDITACVPELDPYHWHDDIRIALAGGTQPERGRRMFRIIQDKTDQNWLTDKLTVRWLTSSWDFDDAVAQLDAAGYPSAVAMFDVDRQSINNGEFGAIIGRTPPW